MAKKSNANVETQVFSTIDINRLQQATNTIVQLQKQSDELKNQAIGIAQAIGGQLYIIDRHNLYKIDDCKNTAEWAQKKFNISRSTCSEAVNTYRRFGSVDNIGTIAPNYSAYKFTALIAMKNLSDEQIKEYGINPNMPKDEIKEIIKQRKTITDVKTTKDNILKSMEDKVRILRKTDSVEDVQNVIKEVVPDFFNKEKELTVEEVKAADEAIQKALALKMGKEIEGIAPQSESKTESENSTVEQFTELDKNFKVNLNDYLKENGTYDKKAFLAKVWEAANGLMNSSLDIITISRA